MGKRLIIKNADFSAYAIESEDTGSGDSGVVTPPAQEPEVTITEVDITSEFTFTDNYNVVADIYNSENQFGTLLTSSRGAASNYVALNDAERIKLNMIGYQPTGDGTGGIVFYSNNNVNSAMTGYYFRDLEMSSVSGMAEREIVVPTGAMYVRVTVDKDLKSEFYAKLVYREEVELTESDITTAFTFTDNYNVVADRTSEVFGKNNPSSRGAASNFVMLAEAESVIVNMISYPVDGDGTGGIVFYSNNNDTSAILGYFFRDENVTGVSGMVERKIAIPTGAMYMRVTIDKDMKSDFYAKLVSVA